MRLHFVVLGAGQGTRMNSQLPKILHAFQGRPVIEWILDTVVQVPAQSYQLVVRFQQQLVRDFVSTHFPTVQFVEQDEIPGTGQAVKCAVSQLVQQLSDPYTGCIKAEWRNGGMAFFKSTHDNRQNSPVFKERAQDFAKPVDNFTIDPLIVETLTADTSTNATNKAAEYSAAENKAAEYSAAENSGASAAGASIYVTSNSVPQKLNEDVVVALGGDAPLITPELLNDLVKFHVQSGNQLSLRTVVVDDPSGYGRIVRNNEGALQAIVEHKDATAEQLQIREVNPSVWAFDLGFLVENLPKLTNQNAKSEFYLTDLVALADRKDAYIYPDALALESFNTVQELRNLEEKFSKTKE